jgi:hypothetical protein
MIWLTINQKPGLIENKIESQVCAANLARVYPLVPNSGHKNKRKIY